MHFVYELIDPRTDTVGYVGITKNPNMRLEQHLGQYDQNHDKIEWFQSMYAEGVTAKLRIREIVEDEQQARERESHWINEYRDQGIKLTNLHIPSRTHRGTKRPRKADDTISFKDQYKTLSLSIDKRISPYFENLLRHLADEDDSNYTAVANQLVLKLLIECGYDLPWDLFTRPFNSDDIIEELDIVTPNFEVNTRLT